MLPIATISMYHPSLPRTARFAGDPKKFPGETLVHDDVTSYGWESNHAHWKGQLGVVIIIPFQISIRLLIVICTGGGFLNILN